MSAQPQRPELARALQASRAALMAEDPSSASSPSERVIEQMSLAEYRWLREQQQSDPDDGVLAYWSGLVLAAQGREAAACQQLQRALDLGCRHWRVAWQLAGAARAAGDEARLAAACRVLLAGSAVEHDRDPRAAQGDRAVASIPARSRTAPVAQVRESASTPPSVTAIVAPRPGESAEARVRDLLDQTLGARLEILLVDTSGGGLAAPLRALVEGHPNLRCIVGVAGEPLAAAWNRGIREARAPYVTCARVHDRLRADALERLAAELDAAPQLGLVHADCYLARGAGAEFRHHVRVGYGASGDGIVQRVDPSSGWPAPDPSISLPGLWRRSVHASFGELDVAHADAAEHEFRRRVSLAGALQRVPEFLGLCRVDAADPQEGPGAFANVCMVTYNRLEFTREAIAGLIAHTDFPHVLSVIDNASRDGTREYLSGLRDQGLIGNLRLLDENLGVARASNLAWRLEPDASYYVKFDNDIVVEKPWLLDMVRVIEMLPQIGVVGYNFETASYPAVTIGGVQIRPKSPGNIGGACLLIPKRTEERLGFWCEEYGLYGEEDSDYGLRVQLAGLRNVYMGDEAIGIHLPGGRAAAIDAHTAVACDPEELAVHGEYRDWKDEQRRSQLRSDSPYQRNRAAYTSGARPLYVGPGGAAPR